MVRPPLTPQHYRNTLARSLNLEMKYPLWLKKQICGKGPHIIFWAHSDGMCMPCIPLPEDISANSCVAPRSGEDAAHVSRTTKKAHLLHRPTISHQSSMCDDILLFLNRSKHATCNGKLSAPKHPHSKHQTHLNNFRPNVLKSAQHAPLHKHSPRRTTILHPKKAEICPSQITPNSSRSTTSLKTTSNQGTMPAETSDATHCHCLD
jgi:hypothetical protein